MADSPAQPVTVKKYANRRLYNTDTSNYVTLDSLAAMVKDGVEFVVVDARTGDDITRQVLTQIIVEEEAKGDHLLPVSFLRQLIAFYGDSVAALVPDYLEHSMGAFARNQERMREVLAGAAAFPFVRWEELGRQNMAMFERALSMMAPPGMQPGPARGRKAKAAKAAGAGTGAGEAAAADTLQTLRDQLDALQRQVDRLSGK